MIDGVAPRFHGAPVCRRSSTVERAPDQGPSTTWFDSARRLREDEGMDRMTAKDWKDEQEMLPPKGRRLPVEQEYSNAIDFIQEQDKHAKEQAARIAAADRQELRGFGVTAEQLGDDETNRELGIDQAQNVQLAWMRLYTAYTEAKARIAALEADVASMERAGAEQVKRADENRAWALRVEAERDRMREERDVYREAWETREAWLEITSHHDISESENEMRAMGEADEAVRRLRESSALAALAATPAHKEPRHG